MIVEETKAPDRICPQMIGQTPEYRWCQGSRCMAWRWAADKNPDYVQPHAMQYPPVMPWDNPMTIASTTHGYCGLAGRP